MNRSNWTRAVLAAAIAACASAHAAPTTTDAAPARAVPLAPTHMDGATVLLVEDVHPWGYRSNERVLKSLGVAWDRVGSKGFGRVVLDQYTTVIVASDQPQEFYDRVGKHLDAVDAWLRHGPRTLEFHAALNVPAFDWELPGGLHVARKLYEENRLSGVESPLLTGLPETMHGTYASHTVFHGRPKHLDHVLITTQGATEQPVLVDYCLGPGRVIATGQTVEFAWAHDWDFAPVLQNMLSASTLTPGCPG